MTAILAALAISCFVAFVGVSCYVAGGARATRRFEAEQECRDRARRDPFEDLPYPLDPAGTEGP